MSYWDTENSDIEPLVDGMVDLLQKNLVANTPLVQDAHIGDITIYVNNTFRFNRNDNIVLMDNNSQYNPDENLYDHIEFHGIEDNITDVSAITLTEPLQADFLVSNTARIQKTIKKAILYDKDILYGDRAVIPFDFVAITVEPERITPEWVALRVVSNEYRLGIMLYVKSGGEPGDEELAQRVCQGYANAIFILLMRDLHIDLVFDEVRLVRDASAGSSDVYIPLSERDNWPVDTCHRYTVQDNFSANQDMSIVALDPPAVSSSSSSGSTSSSSSSDTSETSSLSSNTVSSESSVSSSSSSSSSNDEICKVTLVGPLVTAVKVSDKAVLRRIVRYIYDSRVSDIEYGTVQKGSAILKAAKISWWGKETELYQFPQVGKGGKVY